jgi:hypothetical protein
VTITIGLRTPFNGSISRNRVRTRIAFITIVGEVNGNFRLRAGDNDVGDTIRSTVIDGTEVRMKRSAKANASD